MRAKDLILRCYAAQDKSGDWSALCLDLDIAMQAESLPLVKKKLEEAIDSYIEEALQDKKHFAYLLSRRAPWYEFAIYYWMKLKYKLFPRRYKNSTREPSNITRTPKIKLFDEILPLRFN